MISNGVVASPQYGVANQTDVFVIGNNGQFQFYRVQGGGNWAGPVGMGSAGVCPSRAAVAASPQYGVDNQTDVFAIGNNGQLQVCWLGVGGGQNGIVGLGPTGVCPPGAAVAASPQYGVDKQTDVFAIGNDGRLQVYWVQGGGNWAGPVAMGPDPNVCPPGAGVAASPQYGVANQTDVFAIGNDGRLQVYWVQGGGNWAGPVGLGPDPNIALAALQDSGGRFIQVDGADFTPNGDVSVAYDIWSGGGPTTHETGDITVMADGAGAFTSRISPTLTDISGAAVQATDLASSKSTTNSI
jgi:hypothetical protein